MDDAETADMRAFLTLLGGLPLLRGPSGNTQWGRLSRGLQQIMQGQYDGPELLEYEHEPAKTYGRILTGVALSMGAGYDRHAQRSLGPMPARPDQRAAWTITRWIIDHRAGRHGALVQHVRAVEEACAALRCPRATLALLAAVVPDLYVLLCHSPAQIDGLGEALTMVPVLVGDDVLLGSRRVPVPGRAGRVMVNEALGLPDDTLDPTERRRYRNRLKDEGVMNAPVNLGEVVRTLRAAQPGTDDLERSEWAAAIRTTLKQLSPSVQKVMHHYPL